MKVQWSRHSLRLRLSGADLPALERGEPLSEQLALPGSWHIRLERAAPGQASGLSTQGTELRFTLSPEDWTRLLERDREGLYFRDGPLEFFVEKDRHDS